MALNNNDMDGFERQLKERLENYEVPYNSADWAQMERALASGVRGWGHGRAWVTGLLLASGLLIGGTAYFLGRDTASQMATVQPSTGTAKDAAPAGPGAVTLEAGPEDAAAKAGAPGWEAPSNSSHAAHKAPHGPVHATVPASLPTPPDGPAPAKAAPAVAAGTLFRASAKEACPGSPVEFTVERMPEDGIYLWNFGDGSFSNKPNPQHVYTKPGRYQVMLSMSAPGASAIHNKPTSDMIVIHEAPYAAFNIMKMNHPGQVPSVHFESRAHGAQSYLWDFGDGNVSTLPNPDHVYRKKGTYQVVQTITNEIGCTDRRVQELRIERDFDLGAPKTFSPNNDGKEDSFMPQALLDLKPKFQLSVLDKAGNLVYHTADASRPWYGKAGNQGPVLAQGEYIWVVDVETDRGTETFTGTVDLLP